MTRSGLSVLVGQVWPEGVQVVQEDRAVVDSKEGEAKTRIAQSLAMGAGLLMAAFAGYGMVRGDGALIDRIFNLMEWVLIWLLGWAVGRSH